MLRSAVSTLLTITRVAHQDPHSIIIPFYLTPCTKTLERNFENTHVSVSIS